MAKVLVACEESQAVCMSFRAFGHEAYSCDIQKSSGAMPWYHIHDRVENVLGPNSWDLVLAFPPCTHLCSSGARWWPAKKADGSQMDAIMFFMQFTTLTCPWVIENPIGMMSRMYRKPDQIIQPWQYGHGETKSTCLWLNKLPLLQPTNVVSGREQRIHKMGPSKDRSKLRSKTYEGVADAMAKQWGPLV